MVIDSDKQQSNESPSQAPLPARQIPKGVVLGPDGKPCRSCTSFASWAATTKKNVTNPATGQAAVENTRINDLPSDCPPDVDALGRASWTLLHSIAAQYPVRPTLEQQSTARLFVKSLSQLYPCWTCASDFQSWLRKDENAPRVSSRSDFGVWLCEAHNEVNKKLGKSVFDCSKWEQRWRTGWTDGRCD